MEEEELPLVNDSQARERWLATPRSVSLTWHNINVYVRAEPRTGWCCWGKDKGAREPEKQVLANVSGNLEPGSLLAVMGSSGSGKTTLLNVLTGRTLQKLRVHGIVMVNGRPAQGNLVTRISAYVQQEDLFIGTLTVREHLTFQAHLRLDSTWTSDEILDKVDEILQEMGLLKCSETLIGIPGRVQGISGGERKRLAFASEMLSKPWLLFCDEPTTGLDSFMACSVVSALKELSACGRSVVCVIHQPSSEIFAQFDQLLLLAEGRVAYSGEAREAASFFARQGMRCPLNFNPGDYYISQLAVVQGNEMKSRNKIKKICDYFDRHREAPEFTSSVTKEIEAGSGLLEFRTPEKFAYKSSWFRQMRVLLWRGSIVTRREKLVTVFRLFQTLSIACIICLVYGGQQLDQNGVVNINGVIYLMLVNLSFQNALNVLRVFCDEFPVFLREHWSGLYRTDTYFLSKTLSELPMFSFLPALLIAIVYYCIGLNRDPLAFLVAVSLCILVGNAACSYGYMISGLSRTSRIASIVLLPSIMPLFLYGGYFIRHLSVPLYFGWIKYLSWFYYANEAMCVNQWKGVVEIDCNNSSVPCLSSGSMVLDNLQFQKDHLYTNIGCLVALIVLYRVMAYFGIVLKSRQPR